ncbi:MAG: F-type H+-transporting ATPase subunit b [Salibacteraceae bacterium]|jgi:F-type H+-transporting ATPase subunit b
MEKLIHDFSFGLFIWQSLIFIVLVFLLKKFAWKPILSSVEDREEGIRSALDEAKAAKEEMAKLKSANEDLLKEARAEREAMLAEARDIKVKIVGEASAVAKEEAARITASAHASINAEKEKAMVEIKNQVAEMSIEVASLILKENLSTDASQKALAEKYVKALNLN